MRFVGRTPARALGVGCYLAIRAEPHRPGDAPPDLPAGARIEMEGGPAEVIAVRGPEAVVAHAGRRWRISRLKPSEIGHHRVHWSPGEGVSEWVVRDVA